MAQPQTTIETVRQRTPLLEKSADTDTVNYQKPPVAKNKGSTAKQNGSSINNSRKKGHSNTVVEATLAPSQYQTEISGALILLTYALHQQEQFRPYTSKLLTVQYAKNGYAQIGAEDAYFVLFAVVWLTFARSILVDYILRYVAIKARLRTKKAIARFVEQSWSIIYYSTSFSAGMYLFKQSEYWMSATNLWKGWPHYEIPVLTKAYYLIQLACWFQQIYVLHVEERRKDHYQMFTHHIITCALIIGSYYYYYTRVGHVILILMDVVDIQLSLAKVFNYFEWRTICDTTFGIFMLSWMVCRHGIYNYLVYTAMTSAIDLIPTKCYSDEVTGEHIRCFTPAVHWTDRKSVV